MNLLDYYFVEQRKAQDKYGKHTIVFLQNGAFYEAYQYNTTGYDLQKLSEILNFVVTRKNKSVVASLQNPFMFGIPVIVWDKNLRVLIENGYTIVQIDEITAPPKPKRGIVAVHSPATYINEIASPDSSYICSIFIEEGNRQYECGIVVMDISTGKIYMMETRSEKDDNNLPLDDIIKVIQTYQCREIILTVCNMVSFDRDQLVSLLEIVDKLHFYRELDRGSEVVKIRYQEMILLRSFGHLFTLSERNNVIEAMDMAMMTYARVSLVVMLEYVADHSMKLSINLELPVVMEKRDYLYLGNNAVYQLNIFNNDQNNVANLYYRGEQYKCLFDIINRTSTAIGRRPVKSNIINPLLDVDYINWRYEMIGSWRNKEFLDSLDDILVDILDIERYSRKISLQSLHPLDFYKCVMSIKSSYKLLRRANIDMPHVSSLRELMKRIKTFLLEINKTVNLDEMQKYMMNDIGGLIFVEGVHEDLDEMLKNIKTYSCAIDEYGKKFNDVLGGMLNKKKMLLDGDDEEEKVYIKVINSGKEGFYYEATKKRGEMLAQHFASDKNITFKTGGATTKIYVKEVSDASWKIEGVMDMFRKLSRERYMEFLGFMNLTYGQMMVELVGYIGEIDYLKSGARCALLNNYCRPVIDDRYNAKSYFVAKRLRHPICEKLLKNSEYVPMDIELGTPEQNGVLLFGLNSAGKSTLQKSIGINVLMAQMGYYVAGSSFEYYPYNNLMTRISGNDNMFKHMSSFEVEMNELKAILKRSDRNTLIIADEVCRGTEHRGSLTIVMTMLEILTRKECSFITATHLHDILKVERINRIKGLRMYHLHLDYDEQNNVIVYDRTLREGSGRSEYGFQLAKFLINDSGFICCANEINAEINAKYEKQSKYNPNVWMSECQVCGYRPTEKNHKPLETHHIKFQKNADENGFVMDHMHKNNRVNLCVLCDACHDKIDTNELVIYGYKETSDGLVLDYKVI